jgi:hypothetical protein
MATRNDVTGQEIKSRGNSQTYKDNWDAIFGKKKEEEPKPAEPKAEDK